LRNAHDDGRSRSHEAAEATTHVRRATPDWVAQVIERGLAHAGESGFEVVGLEVDRADDVLREVAETSLYRPDLDLVVHDSSDSVAAYGLFWYDPATATGLVEPMRTEDDHQRRGLARHILTTGVDLLAEAGASASRSAMNQTTRRRNISTSAPASSPIGRPRSSQVRQAEECL
jgi:GNAT superfamily N-acetyltransferase